MTDVSNQLICHVIMAWTSRENKLSIRVERGTKPKLKTSEDGKSCLVTVPSDTFVNWPPIKAELQGGYVVTVQRLQQQYKIEVKHIHERKPELVVYSSPFTHEKDIKTQVKEINTQISHVGIAGPNLDVCGVLKGTRLTLEASSGTMHVNAKILMDRVTLNAQNIVVAPEALVSTAKLKVVCRKFQLDGKIYPSETAESPRHMDVDIDAGLVHLGVDGCIGESNEKENLRGHRKSAASSSAQIRTDSLVLRITGSVANYGRIVATDKIELEVAGSVLSLADGTFDSAGRGYGALKQIRGIRAAPECAPSSSQLRTAILSQNTAAAAHLIESGVDLNDTVRCKRKTLRQTAASMYREKKKESTRNGVRQNITLINALFTVHDWRRGSITANTIVAYIAKNCDDCAQFGAAELQLKIGGKGSIEADSIWACTWVEVEVGSHLTIAGQVKHRTMMITCGDTVTTTKNGIISEEIFARVSCKKFDCDGIWTVGENFTLEVQETAIFHENSHLESEKMELSCDGDVVVDGSWQIATCWARIGGQLTVAATAKVFVEETMTVGAQSLFCHGFVNVTDSFDLHLRKFAHFFGKSKTECNVFNLVCESCSTVGGLWIADILQVYTRQELITTSTGKVAVFSNATVTTGAFHNDATWQIEKDCKMIVGEIEQSDDGLLFVKQSLELAIHAESSESWAGRIICSNLQMRCHQVCCFDGYLRANDVEIYLPYPNESQMTATGQWDILSGPLTLKGNSDFASSSTKRHPWPAFLLSGKLTATAIVAPFVSLEIGEEAVARVSGIPSPHPETEFNVLVSAGAFSMRKGSTLFSLAKDVAAEGIICASSWHHQGQIRFNAEEVHLLAGSWVNKGRLTNTEAKQNHVKCCSVVIEELFLNEGTLACDFLKIVGEGVLDNRGRIFAADTMDIHLSNFCNEEGIMESKNKMNLLSATSDWTKLAGAVKAKRGLDLCASKLQVALKDASHLSRDERLSFSAKTDLILSSAVSDENRRLAMGCAAQRSVALDAHVEIDRLEIHLGAAHSNEPVHLNIKDAADVSVNSLVITGEAKDLRLVIDGSLSCGRLSVGQGFQRVIVSGKGHIDVNHLQAEHSSLAFDLYQLVGIGDIAAKSIVVVKDSIFRPHPPPEADVTTLNCERIAIEGTLFVESKLFLAAAKGGDVHLNGPVIGSSVESELSIEAGRAAISGQVANLKFLEIYAKERCSFNHSKLKNIVGVALDSTELFMSGEMEGCGNFIANCGVVTIEGQATRSTSMCVYATTIHCSVNFDGCEKISLGASGSATIGGSFKNVQNVEVDAKWLTSSAVMKNCTSVVATAWSTNLKGQILASSMSVTALGVILCSGSIDCDNCRMTCPFVVAQDVDLPNNVEVFSLVLLTKDDCQPRGLSYLHMGFEETLIPAKLSITQSDAWKDTAAMMKDRFSSPTVDVDEMLLGLKYISDLNPIRLTVETTCSFYRDLCDLCMKFEKSPISLFSVSDLVALIQNGRKQFPVSGTPEKQFSKKMKKRDGSTLFESLSQFRGTRYLREARGSVDADGGYVSRSSSEDLEVKDRPSSSSSGIASSPIPPIFEHDHLELLEQRLLDQPIQSVDATMEEVNASFLEDEELTEFEELEQEIEDAENDIVRTDFIVCKESRIYLARLKQKTSCVFSPRPRPQFPLLRVPSSNDLVMKRFKVKHTLSTFDLRSFGSESSLASIDFTTNGDLGSPMSFPVSPFQRSRIPRGSFRSPRKTPLLLDH